MPVNVTRAKDHRGDHPPDDLLPLADGGVGAVLGVGGRDLVGGVLQACRDQVAQALLRLVILSTYVISCAYIDERVQSGQYGQHQACSEYQQL